MILYSINGEAPKAPETLNYPDGTLKINIKETDIKRAVLTWRFETEGEFLLLAYMARNIRERFPKAEMELYLPYLPNARMDRVHSGDEVFTLKYFCGLINSLDFSKVTLLDVHSGVGSALLERCTNLSPKAYIEKAKELCGFDSKEDHVFFPDEGSCKRYTELFADCRHIGFGIKKRDWATGKIVGLDVWGESPNGRRIFIVDDICSYGGTVFHSAKKLKELGCGDIDVFFTHCENSIAEGELLKGELIHGIFTTNSLCTLKENKKLTVLDCLKGAV
ncbi:MAG: ribose-phosphate pyrophosphokinase [Ruminococcus sp.]|nr:ribose-phosphate pyrophosphokinase [Ruminococcus sp.]